MTLDDIADGVKCDKCGGVGMVSEPEYDFTAVVGHNTVTCDNCGGSGLEGVDLPEALKILAYEIRVLKGDRYDPPA